MKFLLPLFIIVSVAIAVLYTNPRSLDAHHRNDLRSHMLAIKKYLKPGAVIGCPVDSNHIREFYECRYWLAPAILKANATALDTQLIIEMQDKKNRNSFLAFIPADTISSIRDVHVNIYLVKNRR